jgi:hypothetical protein
MDVFSNTLKTIWFISIRFAVLAFIIVNFEEEIPLRKDLVTEFGIT